jgi:hypothetical protein
VSGESADDDVECDFVINGDDRHGYGYRCACGSRNYGWRAVTRAAIEEERDYHLGVKPRPEVLGPHPNEGVTCSVVVTMKGLRKP